MTPREKALKMIFTNSGRIRQTDCIIEALDIAIQQAKKEVFDDFEELCKKHDRSYFSPTCTCKFCKEYNKLKQKHKIK